MKSTRTLQSRKRRGLRAAAVATLVCAIMTCATTVPALAQYPDTYMIGGGVLRMSFEPSYESWEFRFDTSGAAVPLGADFSFDSTAGNFFPTMTPVETAIWSITSDSSLGITAGKLETELHADVRRFPFNFRIGLNDKLTFTASIPIVTTRMQVDFAVDSSANVGWNQASTVSGAEAAAVPQITALLGQLEASASALEATVNSGGLDCPAGPDCSRARDLVTRARTLVTELIGLTGVDASGTVSSQLPPFAPLSTSTPGQALISTIQDVAAEMQSLGAPAVTESLPLPATAVSPDSIQTVLTETSANFGYDAQPLDFAKYRQKLGDIELGLRFGLLQRPSVRAVISTKVRLPTGTRDAANHYVDIGTGDKQTDIEAGIDLALEPGSVIGIAVAARYNLQLSDQLVRRISPPHQPISLAWTEELVSRDLGDVLTVAAFPTLRLNQSFRAYAAVQYYRKGSDAYSLAGPSEQPHTDSRITPAVLELETGMRRLSLGAGIHFRSSGREGVGLPAEAGIHYYAAYQGSGGFTPKATGLTFYLRLFRRLFGGPPS